MEDRLATSVNVVHPERDAVERGPDVVRKNTEPIFSPQMLFIRGLVLLPNAHCIHRCYQVTSDAPNAPECAGGVRPRPRREPSTSR